MERLVEFELRIGVDSVSQCVRIEDVSLLERRSHFGGWYVQSLDLKMCPY